MGVHLLNWYTLCEETDHGGIDLRRSANMNKAMLTKLAWRLLAEEEEDWCKVLLSKFAVDVLGPVDFKHRHRASYIGALKQQTCPLLKGLLVGGGSACTRMFPSPK